MTETITDVMAADINATIYTEDELKAVALAAHLDIDKDDVKHSEYIFKRKNNIYLGEDECIFDVGGNRYLVCTNEEADTIAETKVFIKRLVKSFLKAIPKAIVMQGVLRREYSEMTDSEMDSEAAKEEDKITKILSKRGRGKILSSYDGKEYISNGFYIYQQ